MKRKARKGKNIKKRKTRVKIYNDMKGRYIKDVQGNKIYIKSQKSTRDIINIVAKNLKIIKDSGELSKNVPAQMLLKKNIEKYPIIHSGILRGDQPKPPESEETMRRIIAAQQDIRNLFQRQQPPPAPPAPPAQPAPPAPPAPPLLSVQPQQIAEQLGRQMRREFGALRAEQRLAAQQQQEQRLEAQQQQEQQQQERGESLEEAKNALSNRLNKLLIDLVKFDPSYLELKLTRQEIDNMSYDQLREYYDDISQQYTNAIAHTQMTEERREIPIRTRREERDAEEEKEEEEESMDEYVARVRQEQEIPPALSEQQRGPTAEEIARAVVAALPEQQRGPTVEEIAAAFPMQGGPTTEDIRQINERLESLNRIIEGSSALSSQSLQRVIDNVASIEQDIKELPRQQREVAREELKKTQGEILEGLTKEVTVLRAQITQSTQLTERRENQQILSRLDRLEKKIEKLQEESSQGNTSILTKVRDIAGRISTMRDEIEAVQQLQIRTVDNINENTQHMISQAIDTNVRMGRSLVQLALNQGQAIIGYMSPQIQQAVREQYERQQELMQHPRAAVIARPQQIKVIEERGAIKKEKEGIAREYDAPPAQAPPAQEPTQAPPAQAPPEEAPPGYNIVDIVNTYKNDSGYKTYLTGLGPKSRKINKQLNDIDLSILQAKIKPYEIFSKEKGRTPNSYTLGDLVSSLSQEKNITYEQAFDKIKEKFGNINAAELDYALYKDRKTYEGTKKDQFKKIVNTYFSDIVQQQQQPQLPPAMSQKKQIELYTKSLSDPLSIEMKKITKDYNEFVESNSEKGGALVGLRKNLKDLFTDVMTETYTQDGNMPNTFNSIYVTINGILGDEDTKIRGNEILNNLKSNIIKHLQEYISDPYYESDKARIKEILERIEVKGQGKKKSEGGLTDTEIDEYMKKYPEYIGSYHINEVGRINPPEGMFGFSVFIPWNKNSTTGHWVGVFIDKDGSKSVEYYDSYGEDPPEKLEKQLKKIIDRLKPDTLLKYKINRIINQRTNSDTCGFMVMDFLKNRFKGKKYKDVTGYSTIMKSERHARKLKERVKRFGYI